MSCLETEDNSHTMHMSARVGIPLAMLGQDVLVYFKKAVPVFRCERKGRRN